MLSHKAEYGMLTDRLGRAFHPLEEKRPMSTEEDREKHREESPEWHRARAKSLREHGFTKMAEEHEQIARDRASAAAGADEITPGCVRVASAMARGCGNPRTKG